MITFDKARFIQKHVTRREESLFSKDLQNNSEAIHDAVAAKSVLVIGGAGTIGSSYIKAILPFEPAELTVVDYSENGLTELTRDLRSSAKIKVPKRYLSYPFDFGSEVFAKMFKASRFDIVACFAAHKHVRSEKDHLAIEAMIRNNVFNTKRLIDLSIDNPPQHFFSVSTDKAANPVNVMGASKKLMEKVILSNADKLCVSTARFANVAFSNGSLLAGFMDRLAKRQPLSSPKDVKRYFVSPEESGQLCLLASVLGESSDIFFPKLDENQMMTFSEIAENLLSEMGYLADHCSTEEEAREKAHKWKPSDSSYPVYFFDTDTSGEKLYEEFFTKDDQIDMESLYNLGVIKTKQLPDVGSIEEILSELQSLFDDNSSRKADIVNLLKTYLADFDHIESGKSLDDKM